MSYILLPPQGSAYWADPVANLVDLPLTDPIYTVREVKATLSIYVWTGVAWIPVGAGLAPSAITDTNSVDLTVTAGVLSADVRLSTDLADAGYVLSEVAIRSGASKGLRVQLANSLIRGLLSGTNLITYTAGTGVIDLTAATIRALLSGTSPILYDNATGIISIQVATGAQNGYLSSTDWNTFNNKEPAISSGTTAQYWRGDKTFQTLQVSAMTAVTDGSAAAVGKIGEILTASQASNTTTGVGSTGTYGSVVSLALTAGVWRVHGTAGFNENGAVLTTALECGISASATGVAISEFNTTINPYLISSTSDALFSTPMVDVNIASPTTYYLNSKFTYTSGTPRHRGKITAIRIR